MKDKLARLQLDDLENEVVDGVEESYEEDDFVFCLAGRMLTDGSVHFSSFRNVLSELWRLIEGITIIEIEDKHFLFRFYNEVDLQRMMKGIPLFFNRHLIIFHKLQKGENPM